MKTRHRIVIGDSRKMDVIQDESVHLIATSPPYWQLKDYGSSTQIGFHDTYEAYINNLNLVWKECFRILHSGCRLCVNIGDQFARSVYYGRYKVIPIRTEIIKFCETIGFDYMGAIIWQKVTTSNTTGGATIMGSFPYPRNGILKLDYEFILIFKKPGNPPKVDHAAKAQSKMTTDEWNTYFAGHWNFSGERQDKHLAMFPVELPTRLIKMFTFIGETVVDPFLGSGTTSLAAKNLGRHSIGYEINAEFLPIITSKLGVDTHSLFTEEFEVECTTQQGILPVFTTEIQQLPYIFKDPVKLDKKIDPRQLGFGSKIDQQSVSKTEYFSVNTVITPEKLILNNGLHIHLIGIKTDEQKKEQAIEFLRNMTKGQKVFLKYDQQKFDAENNIFCYLYLKNKTFVNAYLLRHQLVFVDETYDFQKKDAFQKYYSGERSI